MNERIRGSLCLALAALVINASARTCFCAFANGSLSYSVEASLNPYVTYNSPGAGPVYGPARSTSESGSNPALFNGNASLVDGGGDYATQNETSSINPDSILVSGTFVSQPAAFAGTGQAEGDLVADISFSVSAPQPFTLSADILDAYDSIPSRRMLLLSGPGVDVNWSSQIMEGTNNLSFSGTMEPGQYQLDVEMQSIHVGAISESNLLTPTISLTTPEPAFLGPVALGIVILSVARRRRRNAAPLYDHAERA